jgi:hypothetical protein
VRFLLRETGAAYLDLCGEIAGLREEVAALGAAVERFRPGGSWESETIKR